MNPVVFGTRGSALALAQTKQVMAQLAAAWPGRTFELRLIKTQGDRLSEAEIRPLGGMLSKGLFTGELERALREREIDLAVHSLKDLPTSPTEGLTLAAIPPRADARDVIVTRGAASLEELPSGALLATGSPRRAAQVRAVRRDLKTEPIRGNVDTRIRKFRDRPELAGLVLAAAGLDRLRPDLRGLTVTPLPITVMLPAAGQGGARAANARGGPGHARARPRSPRRRDPLFPSRPSAPISTRWAAAASSPSRPTANPARNGR